jgi:hypothetical protein
MVQTKITIREFQYFGFNFIILQIILAWEETKC